jgi:hypothetical protein
MRLAVVALVCALFGGIAVAQTAGDVDAYGNPIINELPRRYQVPYDDQYPDITVPRRDPTSDDMSTRRRGEDLEDIRRSTPPIPENAP